jgi:hypothetical protein
MNYFPKLKVRIEFYPNYLKYDSLKVAEAIYIFLKSYVPENKIEEKILGFDDDGFVFMKIRSYLGLSLSHQGLFQGYNYNEIIGLLEEHLNEDARAGNLLGVLSLTSEQIANLDSFILTQSKLKEEAKELFYASEDEIEEHKKYIESISRIRNNKLQSKFRKNVLEEFGEKCALCGIDKENLLIAAHIFPFYMSDRIEDAFSTNNGILLCPIHDSLFESGRYITIEPDGRVLISSEITQDSYSKYNLIGNSKISDEYINPSRIKYLKLHNQLFKDLNNKIY